MHHVHNYKINVQQFNTISSYYKYTKLMIIHNIRIFFFFYISVRIIEFNVTHKNH